MRECIITQKVNNGELYRIKEQKDGCFRIYMLKTKTNKVYKTYGGAVKYVHKSLEKLFHCDVNGNGQVSQYLNFIEREIE